MGLGDKNDEYYQTHEMIKQLYFEEEEFSDFADLQNFRQFLIDGIQKDFELDDSTALALKSVPINFDNSLLLPLLYKLDGFFHYSCRCCNVETVKWIIDNKLITQEQINTVKKKFNSSDTPLHCLMERVFWNSNVQTIDDCNDCEEKKIAGILIALGIDDSLKNKKGKTAKDILKSKDSTKDKTHLYEALIK